MKQRWAIVADDDADMRVLIGNILGGMGFEALLAANGDEAIAFLGQYSVCLVITDWVMPKKSGADVLTEMIANPHWRRIPVIAMSGTAREREVKDAGAKAFMKKPFPSIQAVKDTVSSVLSMEE